MTVRPVRNLFVFVLSVMIGLGAALADRAPEPYEPRHHTHKYQPPPAPKRHDTTFKTLPDSKLQIRAVEYDGATNGSLKVELKNTTNKAIAFSAQGLYFVPDGDPDKAPQRLGAVGQMQLAKDGTAKSMSTVDVQPGATVEVALDVFCIDSHRSSPSTMNSFAVGAKRMPKELATTIDTRATKTAAKYKADYADGARAPAPAMSEIQAEVWKSRDAKWVKLDGEGSQEATK